MAKRKAQRHSPSGAPGVSQKRSAGAPALNPLTIKQRYLDGTVALQEHVTEWQKFWDNPRKVERFSKPVRSRIK